VNSSTADAELMLLPAPSAETIEVHMEHCSMSLSLSVDAMQGTSNSRVVAVCWEQLLLHSG